VQARPYFQLDGAKVGPKTVVGWGGGKRGRKSGEFGEKMLVFSFCRNKADKERKK